jgi:hypothetical protein
MTTNDAAATLASIHDYALELLASGDQERLRVGLDHISNCAATPN